MQILETEKSQESQEAINLVDAALIQISGRTFVETGEMVDLLLDIRRLLEDGIVSQN